MTEYAPDQNFKHPVCRGSWAFGNNCKVCERCQATHPGRAGTQLLTNPNHTDTSRSGDLVERLRSHDYDHAYNLKTDEELYAERDEAADLIEPQAREIERLNAILSEMNDTDVIARTMAENERLREVLVGVAASLAAAISLLERGGKAAKKAAPSDLMFDQMVRDYTASLERARAALGEK